MLKTMFLAVCLVLGLGCAYAFGQDSSDKALTDGIVTAEAVAEEAPAVGSEPDDPGLGTLSRIDLPRGWTLENTGGDSTIMSHADGSRAIILQRRNGCSGHISFTQDGMNCLVSFDRDFGPQDEPSDQMFAAVAPQPDGTMEVRYLLVNWPEAAVRQLEDSFVPGRRHAVCTR